MTAVGQYSQAGIIHMLITGQAKKKSSKGEPRASAASESADFHTSRVGQPTSGYLHKKGSQVLQSRRITLRPASSVWPFACLTRQHVRIVYLTNAVQNHELEGGGGVWPYVVTCLLLTHSPFLYQAFVAEDGMVDLDAHMKSNATIAHKSYSSGMDKASAVSVPIPGVAIVDNGHADDDEDDDEEEGEGGTILQQKLERLAVCDVHFGPLLICWFYYGASERGAD